jgi:hypothetical protein
MQEMTGPVNPMSPAEVQRMLEINKKYNRLVDYFGGLPERLDGYEAMELHTKIVDIIKGRIPWPKDLPD